MWMVNPKCSKELFGECIRLTRLDEYYFLMLSDDIQLVIGESFITHVFIDKLAAKTLAKCEIVLMD